MWSDLLAERMRAESETGDKFYREMFAPIAQSPKMDYYTILTGKVQTDPNAIIEIPGELNTPQTPPATKRDLPKW